MFGQKKKISALKQSILRANLLPAQMPPTVEAVLVAPPEMHKSTLFQFGTEQLLQCGVEPGWLPGTFVAQDMATLSDQNERVVRSARTLQRQPLTSSVGFNSVTVPLVAESVLANLKLTDSIGQVVSRAGEPESAIQDAVQEHRKRLRCASVWIFNIRFPTNSPSCRHNNSRKFALTQLAQARLERTEPVCVALNLSGADIAFATEADAKKAVTRERLAKLVQPFRPLLNSPKIADWAAFVTSPLGYGRTTPVDHQGRPKNPTDPGRTIWLLKEGVSPCPANVRTLLLWTLRVGLQEWCNKQKLAPADAERYHALIDYLFDAIHAIDGWYFTAN